MAGAIVAIIFVILFFVTIKPKKAEMKNEKLELLQQQLEEIELGNEKLELLQQQLEEIELKVIDLTSPHDLMRVEAFNLLIEAHKDTVDVSLICQFFGDESRSEVHKQILFFSLNEAPFDSYLKVFECCVDLYKKKKIDDYFIWLMVLPAWDDFGNFSLVENYKDKRLRKIIIEYKKKLPVDMKKNLDLLLSGILWKAIEKDRELYRKHNNAQH
jgi:hypothetical protein